MAVSIDDEHVQKLEVRSSAVTLVPHPSPSTPAPEALPRSSMCVRAASESPPCCSSSPHSRLSITSLKPPTNTKRRGGVLGRVASPRWAREGAVSAGTSQNTTPKLGACCSSVLRHIPCAFLHYTLARAKVPQAGAHAASTFFSRTSAFLQDLNVVLENERPKPNHCAGNERESKPKSSSG